MKQPLTQFEREDKDAKTFMRVLPFIIAFAFLLFVAISIALFRMLLRRLG